MNALAFDLDGTLISCRDRQVGLARTVLEQLSVKAFAEADFWRAKRNGATTHQALRAAGVSAAQADRAADGWLRLIEAPEWLAFDRALPSAVAALCDSRRAGFLPVVLTARRNPDRVTSQLQRLGLDRLIARTVVVSPVFAQLEKSHWLRKLGAAGYIGDTELDWRAAAAVSLPFAAVHSGQREARYLRLQGIRHTHGTVGRATAALISELTSGQIA